MFDFSNYHVRELDINQGYKPLDFGMGGLTGSVNKDGRIIAINNYHPEHGYVTLTRIPPFPDADRYDQSKVRAYRKSLVTNEGFGLRFEQEIIKREYYLIEDAVPFMRFTFADGTIAECVTTSVGSYGAVQIWQFSRGNVHAIYEGNVWLKRAEFTQLTEGGILPMPSILTSVQNDSDTSIHIFNEALKTSFYIRGVKAASQNQQAGITFDDAIICERMQIFLFTATIKLEDDEIPENFVQQVLEFRHFKEIFSNKPLVISRALFYGNLCLQDRGCLVTDHMVLPLLWTRDSYYVADVMKQHATDQFSYLYNAYAFYIQWLFEDMWRGTYCKSIERPLASALARSYLPNGMPKDNRAFQLDQQIFPFLTLANYLKRWKRELDRQAYSYHVKNFLDMLVDKLSNYKLVGLFPTDETPADDEIPLQYHFSSHLLLWHTLRELEPEFTHLETTKSRSFQHLIEDVENAIPKYFITEHDGKKLYAYATDGEGNYHFYHDANDIPLVMMPLWSFCSKDDPVWRNTIDFAFSDDNPGFFDGVLGSVHTPAPWSLGDAQELILCKVIGDRERYQRVWERIEKAAQWDGALPEAYDAKDYSVVSRHWFAWTNAMVAIADNISWEWEAELQK